MESETMVLTTVLSDTGHAPRSTGQGLIASRAFITSERSVAVQLVVEMMRNLNDSIDDFAPTYVAAIYELSVVIVVACYRPGHSLEGTNAQGAGGFVYTTGQLPPCTEMVKPW